MPSLVESHSRFQLYIRSTFLGLSFEAGCLSVKNNPLQRAYQDSQGSFIYHHLMVVRNRNSRAISSPDGRPASTVRGQLALMAAERLYEL